MTKFNINMGSILKSILAVSLVALLAGCTTYGVSNQQWSQMTPRQKQQAMQIYAQQQRADARHQAKLDRIKAENAPLDTLVSGLVGALPSESHSWGSSHTTHNGNDTNTTSSGGSVTW